MTINIDEIFAQSSLDIRLAQPEDEEFLERVFVSTREDLLALNLPATMLQPLLRQQYQLQQHAYRTQWPQASYRVIYAMGLAVGKCMLATTETSLHIVDIGLLPQARGKGLGTSLIKAIQAAALHRDIAISLSVDNQNQRAHKLYKSLGFFVVGASATHDAMQWRRALDSKN